MGNNIKYLDSKTTYRGTERKRFTINVRGKKGDGKKARETFQHDYCKENKPIITIEPTATYPIINVWTGCMFTTKNQNIRGTYAKHLIEYLNLTSE